MERKEEELDLQKVQGIGNGTLFWPDDDRVLTSIRLRSYKGWNRRL